MLRVQLCWGLFLLHTAGSLPGVSGSSICKFKWDELAPGRSELTSLSCRVVRLNGLECRHGGLATRAGTRNSEPRTGL